MAKTDFNIPSLGGKFEDLRNTLPGDAYNWSWIRPLSQVRFLAIHHSGGLDNQTPLELAQYHINNNGWGGIGYHFIIDKEGTVFYVGDLQTARANVADLNEQVIGVCLIGNFVGNAEPTQQQMESTRGLCNFFINECPELININSWDCVKGHQELPGQSTNCPGDNWLQWKQKIVSDSTLPTSIVFNTRPQEAKSETSASLQGQIAMLQETVDYQKTQIDSLQMSLATINGQLISCREALQEAETKPSVLPTKLGFVESAGKPAVKGDDTLTLIDAIMNLYRFIFLWGKVNQ